MYNIYRKHGIYSVRYYLQFQAATGGLGTNSLWIGGGTTVNVNCPILFPGDLKFLFCLLVKVALSHSTVLKNSFRKLRKLLISA